MHRFSHELEQPERQNSFSELPFSLHPITETTLDDSTSPQDIHHIGRKIFQAWYQHQELPREEAVADLRVSHPTSSLENLQNLLIDSYLFAKRATLHAAPGLDKTTRLEAAIQDVRFQQAATSFLLSTENEDVRQEFWDDFRANQDSVKRTENEKVGAEKGIRSVEAVVRELQSDGWEVFFPDPLIDARDKVDLVAKRKNETVFVQVKSQTEESEKSIKKSADAHRQDKLAQFDAAVQRYAKQTGLPITGRVVTARPELLDVGDTAVASH